MNLWDAVARLPLDTSKVDLSQPIVEPPLIPLNPEQEVKYGRQ